jgi:ribosomal protein S13
MSQMDDVSRSIGMLQGQLEAITKEVLRYHSIAEDERHEMREELKELRREISELKGLRNKGAGIIAALLFVAALLGSKAKDAMSALFG